MLAIPKFCWYAAAALLPLVSPSAQSRIYQLEGDAPGDRFGLALAAAGDLDADGYSDVLAAAPGALGGRFVRVLSGRDGRVLRDWSAPAGSGRFGFCLAGGWRFDLDLAPDVVIGDPDFGARAGRVWLRSGATGADLLQKDGLAGEQLGYVCGALADLDRDGVPELWAGAPGGGTAGAGRFVIWSGKSGKELRAHEGARPGAAYGQAAAAGGDADDDDVPDYLVASVGLGRVGSVELRSGADGKLLHTMRGVTTDDGFGIALAFLSDLDGDGADDFAIGSPWGGAAGGGAVEVYSGKAGKPLLRIESSTAGEEFGFSIAGAGDLDEDGLEELLVGVPRAAGVATDAGEVRVLRGAHLKDGKGVAELFVLDAFAAADRAGHRVASVGDVDGDGIPELGVGVPGADLRGTNRGAVELWSARDRALVSDRHELSLASGGVARWSLSAGLGNAGDLFLLLGSASGTSPGTKIGSLAIPLNLDSYTSFLLGAPGTLVAPNFGFFDALGRAQSGFVLPAGFPAALVGLRLDHAFLVIEIDGSDLEFASNSIPLRFGP